MTLQRAREILGKYAEGWSDERLQLHVDRLRVIARIAANQAIKHFPLKCPTDSAYYELETQNHVQKSPAVAVTSSDVIVSQTAGVL